MEERGADTLLGRVLLAEGVVTPEDLQVAMYRQKETGDPLEAILIAMGSLAPRQLERALRAQARLRGGGEQRGQSILVVDDEPAMGALVTDILTGLGYRVGIAHCEAEAMAAALASDGSCPDLIVLDLGLPEHGGIELLTVLRRNGATCELPVVVLTGHPHLESEIQRRSLHISGFLVKPVSVRRLAEMVATALGSGVGVEQRWGGP